MLDNFKIYVRGYKQLGKPREKIKGKRGECVAGFLISESLLDDITVVENVKFDETI